MTDALAMIRPEPRPHPWHDTSQPEPSRPSDPFRDKLKARARLEQDARQLYSEPGAALTRSEPVAADNPYLRFKLPDDPRYDEPLKAAMTQRRAELALRLDTGKITVFAADLSSNPAESAAAIASVRHHLPGRNRSRASDLQRIVDAGRKPTISELQKALYAYSGSTLVLVGHTTQGHSEMVLTTAKGLMVIDISLWNAVASQEGVNLIVLGCRSAGSADIGSPYLLNSGPLFASLGAALKMRRTTFADFYRQLTSEDLVLSVSPFANNLGYLEFTLTDRDGREVGTITWRPPQSSASGSPSRPLAGLSAACLAAATSVPKAVACRDAERASQDQKSAKEQRKTAARDLADATVLRERTLFYALLGAAALGLLSGIAFVAERGSETRERRRRGTQTGSAPSDFAAVATVVTVLVVLAVLVLHAVLILIGFSAALAMVVLGGIKVVGLIGGAIDILLKGERKGALALALVSIEIGLVIAMAVSELTIDSVRQRVEQLALIQASDPSLD